MLSGLFSIKVGITSVNMIRLSSFARETSEYVKYADSFKRGGIAGFVVAILLFIAGILSIKDMSYRNRETDLMLMIVYGIATAIALLGGTTIYIVLYLWAVWCLINFVAAGFSFINPE